MLATVGSHWCLLVAPTGGPNWWPPLVVIGGLYYWFLDTCGPNWVLQVAPKECFTGGYWWHPVVANGGPL